MSGAVIAFPRPAVHLWIHPTGGGWVGIVVGRVDPDWPNTGAMFMKPTRAARQQAADLAAKRGLPLHVHAEEF
jgi:hypothetical protein